MPQPSFWSTRHAVGMSWRYAVDLTKPQAPPKLITNVYDQGERVMASHSALLPPTLIDDAVVDVLVQGWHTYLYGEPDALREILSGRQRAWWAHADAIS